MATPASTAAAAAAAGVAAARRSGERRRTGSSASVTGESKKKEQKVDQILHHAYSKTTQVIFEARLGAAYSAGPSGGGDWLKPSGTATEGKPGGEGKRDKWFNLDLEDLDVFREELKTWKGVTSLLFPPLSSSSPSSSSSSTHTLNFSAVPTLVLEIVLDLNDLANHQCLALVDSTSGRKVRLDASVPAPPPHPAPHRRRDIVLERWTMQLAPPMPSPPGPELPTVYRHAISHFRALYTLVRTLPVWSLQRRLRKSGNRETMGLKLGCRLSTGEDARASLGVPLGPAGPFIGGQAALVGIDEPLWADGQRATSFAFAPIQTPLGYFQTSLLYRPQVDFVVEDTEAMLSERFIDEDFFTPQLLRAAHPQPRPASSMPLGQQVERPPVASPPASGAGQPGLKKSEYGSLSTAHQLTAAPGTAKSGGAKGKEKEVTSTSPSSLTAAMRAAELGEPPAFALPKTAPGPAPSQHNGSALTAKLMAKRPSLPPVMSNAISASPPITPGHPRLYSHPQVPSSLSPASTSMDPRAISASPGSGPSSSIRITTFRQPSLGGVAASPLSPSFAPTSGPSQSSTVAPRPMAMQTPMLRRYSSSRGPRSYGQGSSSGGSLGVDPGSLGGRRGTRLGGFEGMTSGHSPATDVFGTSFGKAGSGSSPASTMGAASTEDADDINGFLALLDSKPQLKKGASVLNRSQADEVLKRLATSVTSSVFVEGSAGGTSPAEGTLPSPSSGIGGRPGSFSRLTSLSGRPASALDGLTEEEEPGEPGQSAAPAPTRATPSFTPRSYGSSGFQRYSPLSSSPGFPPINTPGGLTVGDVPFPRYTSSRRRASADLTATSSPGDGGSTSASGVSGVAASGEASATASGAVGGQGIAHLRRPSFEEGPVGKLELSLEQDGSQQKDG